MTAVSLLHSGEGTRPQSGVRGWAGRFYVPPLRDGLDVPPTWSVVTEDEVLADSLARHLGGHCLELPTTDGSRFDIDTDSASLRIIIEEPSAVSSHLTLWDSPGATPQPLTSVRFRLDADPGLGIFEMCSESWDLAENIGETEEALECLDGAALAELSVEEVEVSTRRGAVGSFRKQTLQVLGAAESSL